jgi:hypothetical protein
MAMEKSVLLLLPNFWKADSCECVRRLMGEGQAPNSVDDRTPPAINTVVHLRREHFAVEPVSRCHH